MVACACTGSESSPLVHGLSVFVGDQNGTVYSFRTYDGHVNWTFQASGAVKGGVAFAHNTLYFGDYGAHVYAVNAADGGEVWSASDRRPLLDARGRLRPGLHRQHQRGRVRVLGQLGGGRVDPSTGAYVYASPAVSVVPGLGPTVYIGSYDGHLYAYNAEQTALCAGATRAGGRIDGSATVIGNVVYFAEPRLEQDHRGPQLAHRRARSSRFRTASSRRSSPTARLCF